MSELKVDTDDLSFGIDIREEKNVAILSHLKIAEEHRNVGHGSFVIETIKRMIFEQHDVDRIEVAIGGGRSTEEFLKSNGFKIINRRYYSKNAKEHMNGEYGVDAVYKREWITGQYN